MLGAIYKSFGRWFVKHFIIILLLYHVIIGVIFYIFNYYGQPSDINLYWLKISKTQNFLDYNLLPLREYFILYINYPFARWMNLPVEIGFLIYSILGFIGILNYKKTIDFLFQNHLNEVQVYHLILFLPSIHLWTTAPGKDVLCFLSLSYLIYILLSRKSKRFLFIVAAILLMLVRPHIFIIFFSVYIVYYIILENKRVKNLKCTVLIGLFATVIAYIILIKGSWLQTFHISKWQTFIAGHHDYLAGTRLYVPLHEYNIFYRLFSFYFRPLPGEYSDVFINLISLENLIIFLLSFTGIVFGLTQRFRNWPIFFIFISAYFIVFGFILSLGFENFGLIYRQKNMALPFFLLIPLYGLWSLKLKYD